MREFLTKKYFLIGSVLMILGIATWGYGYYTIERLQISLNESSTQDEMWALSGSLQWWKITQVTTFNPLSVVFVAVGVIFIVYWLVLLVRPPVPFASRKEEAIRPRQDTQP